MMEYQYQKRNVNIEIKMKNIKKSNDQNQYLDITKAPHEDTYNTTSSNK